MLFNSIAFAIFLPIVFGLYWWIGKKNKLKLQNFFLLVASYIFYGAWDWRFLILIFFSTLVDFLVGMEMGKRKSRKQRRFLLGISLTLNLGLLGFFKYFNFFADSLQDLAGLFGLHLDSLTLQVVLPVGISFYTFQIISYSIDIFRGKLQPTRDPISFFAFVAFFPQLVAGPIERAANLLPQFAVRRIFDYPMAVTGLRIILWGFFKKIVVADCLGMYVDEVYGNPEDYHGLDVIISTIFFAIQIYGDFSGYSDIALGTAHLFGFRLAMNFRTPFFSPTKREFWSRWHITLNTWFQDYVYFPLGGSRGSKMQWMLNISLVFLISGFWHGAGYTFVIWGLIHAFAYILENLLGANLNPRGWRRGWAIFRTNLIFTFSLFFFRGRSLDHVWTLWTGLFDWNIQLNMFHRFDPYLNGIFSDTGEILYLLLTLVFMFTVDGLIGKGNFSALLDKMPRAGRYAFYYLIISWLLLFGAYGTPVPFIYFQF